MSACTKCRQFFSEVTMTRRLRGGWVKRWRVCKMENCKHAWTTFELPTEDLDVDHSAPALMHVPMRKK